MAMAAIIPTVMKPILKAVLIFSLLSMCIPPCFFTLFELFENLRLCGDCFAAAFAASLASTPRSKGAVPDSCYIKTLR
jgi:hypothetical protein